MTAFPAAVLESAEKMVVGSRAPPDVLDAGAAASAPSSTRNLNPAGNSNMSAYHREFLQNCVEEAMDDFCSDLRRQMWHLHYDMVRSFHLQQESFSQMDLSVMLLTRLKTSGSFKLKLIFESSEKA